MPTWHPLDHPNVNPTRLTLVIGPQQQNQSSDPPPQCLTPTSYGLPEEARQPAVLGVRVLGVRVLGLRVLGVRVLGVR
eukprot:1179941-Prorocentrum_minimum.AAC.1